MKTFVVFETDANRCAGTHSWLLMHIVVCSRDVPNIHFVFAVVPNSGRNSVFVFGRIVSSGRITIKSFKLTLEGVLTSFVICDAYCYFVGQTY